MRGAVRVLPWCVARRARRLRLFHERLDDFQAFCDGEEAETDRAAASASPPASSRCPPSSHPPSFSRGCIAALRLQLRPLSVRLRRFCWLFLLVPLPPVLLLSAVFGALPLADPSEGLHWAHLAETFLAYACVQNIFTVYVARLGREASYSPWPAALAGLSAALALAGLSRAWGVYPVPFAALLPTAVSVPVHFLGIRFGLLAPTQRRDPLAMRRVKGCGLLCLLCVALIAVYHLYGAFLGLLARRGWGTGVLEYALLPVIQGALEFAFDKVVVVCTNTVRSTDTGGRGLH
jgi:hypothetical protein